MALGDRWRELTGRDPAVAAGRGWLDAVHPADAARVERDWRAAVDGAAGFAATFRVGPSPAGPWRSLVARAEPRRDPDGRLLGWSGLAVEVPEPAAPTAAAGADREPMTGGEDFAVFWIADRDDYRLTSVSPSCERLLGRSVAELTGGRLAWPDLAHPDDRSRVVDAYDRRLAGEPAPVEYRLIRADGTATAVRDRVLPALTGSMGDPDRIFGVLEDVAPAATATATATAMAAGPAPAGPIDPALQADRRLRDLHDSAVPVARWRPDGRIAEANEAYLALIGGDPEALRAGELRWDRRGGPGPEPQGDPGPDRPRRRRGRPAVADRAGQARRGRPAGDPRRARAGPAGARRPATSCRSSRSPGTRAAPTGCRRRSRP